MAMKRQTQGQPVPEPSAKRRRELALGDVLQAMAFAQTARNALLAELTETDGRTSVGELLDEAVRHLQRARRNA
jgi:hypothetical protein